MFYQELDKDDSLTLHTDLYEINMMYTYFKKEFRNATRFLRFTTVKSRLAMGILFMQD